AIHSPDDDVLLTTASGQSIRFQSGEEVRLFKGRGSVGVRGIRLDEGDEVISMAILTHVDATPAERSAYIKQATQARRAEHADGEDDIDVGGDSDDGQDAEISAERSAELAEKEQFVLTVSERGYGKRSSSYEYRTSGRGGKGIAAMVTNERNGPLVASFPIESGDQIMLVTDAGQLIRCPVHDVRIAGRNTQGVRVFRTGEDERVVSVERIPEVDDEDPDEDPDDDATDDNGSASPGGSDGAAGDAPPPTNPDAP
ncbi:MAG: DNA gyrase subunit A, partial [Alphaproteobacteria bacterium]|nr:DNA gyrase subunit A [Alphaproteobacteria bacterium]